MPLGSLCALRDLSLSFKASFDEFFLIHSCCSNCSLSCVCLLTFSLLSSLPCFCFLSFRALCCCFTLNCCSSYLCRSSSWFTSGDMPLGNFEELLSLETSLDLCCILSHSWCSYCSLNLACCSLNSVSFLTLSSFSFRDLSWLSIFSSLSLSFLASLLTFIFSSASIFALSPASILALLSVSTAECASLFSLLISSSTKISLAYIAPFLCEGILPFVSDVPITLFLSLDGPLDFGLFIFSCCSYLSRSLCCSILVSNLSFSFCSSLSLFSSFSLVLASFCCS